eukprot:gene2345-4558_t
MMLHMGLFQIVFLNWIWISSCETTKCDDPIWCNVKMPPYSLFKFDPPSDSRRWKQAQIRAASGDHILLERIVKTFKHPFDFLDGDRGFRSLHQTVDIFVDDSSWLTALTKDGVNKITTLRAQRKPKSDDQKWQKERKYLVPESSDWIEARRAPIVSVGYNAFARDANTFFAGNYLGGHYVQKKDFLKNWKLAKDDIIYPFIAMCSLNENWGWLSSYFPNRTAAWGSCCYRRKDALLHEFLNHKKTLMLIINQHSNISHPKVLMLPRGLPLTWDRTKQLVYQAIHANLKFTKKQTLLFAAASSWGPRPQILQCVSKSFSTTDFEGHSSAPFAHSKDTRLDRLSYYKKLASARFGLCLPGLGYDTFRMWELMTMGGIAVVEKAVGFDRSLWRLPALLVDDFAYVTPELLRTAYVEAMYRADEFEFERLTQSFWWTVMYNVSVTGHIGPMLDKFPMEAEDPNFTRAKRPYPCGMTDTCGPNTKRIPAKSC